MSLPLVIELQQLAQSGATDVSELLRRAKVVASKLKLDDFDEWFNHELNGYPEEAEVPDYRVVPSRLMHKNPFHGLQPVYFTGELKPGAFNLAEHFASLKMRQPIAQVAHLVTSIMKGTGTGTLECALGVGEMDALGSSNPDFLDAHPVRVVNNGAVVAILEAVRNRVLKWSLELERKGIIGADMAFTKDEQEKAAAQITINNYGSLGSVVHGAGSTVTTAQHSPGSEVNVATSNARLMKRLTDAIDAVRKLDSQTATAIERLAEGLQRRELPEPTTTEATEALTVVAEQSALSAHARLPKSVLVPIVTKVRDGLGVTADLLQVWGSFGPAIVGWLSVILK